jgi:ParB family chromosome partitioning protein
MTTERKSRLGKGLDALLGGDGPDDVPGTRQEVAIAGIDPNPSQPRKEFDSDELKALADSIKTHGVLQPVIVRAVGERFQLIAGERRLKAAQIVGLDQVPVTVVNFNDQQCLEAALVENIQRSDLNPIEKAHGFREYLDRFKMTQEQLAARLGLGRTTVTNLVSLLDLPEEVQNHIKSGTLTLGHAKILKGITDAEKQKTVIHEILTKGLSCHATEALLKSGTIETALPSEEETTPNEPKSSPVTKTAHVTSIEDELRQKLGLRVEIRVKSKDKGQILLRFESNDDFERVVEALRR